MDPLKEIGRKQKAMDKGAYRAALNRPIDAIQQSTPYRLADLIMNGEDADISMAESLIPTLSLQKKLQQGKLPGLADILDIPSPLKAMGPIAFGLKELRNGARMGKTLRNVEKAREARDYVHRVHRTYADNANGIDKNGLLVGKDNPNYSRNTGDSDNYPPSVWMGVDPTNIPVLQHYFTQQGSNGINKTRTYNIRIPRDIYNQSKRVKWYGGRSGTPVVVSGKENPSLSPETARWTGNQAKIDMIVGSVPKEWLSRIPQKKIHELANKRLAREGLEKEIKDFYGTSNIPRQMLDDKRLQLTSGDELANKLSFEERKAADNNIELEKALDKETTLDLARGQQMTPYGILSDALGRLGDKVVSNTATELPYGTKALDVIRGNIVPTGGIPASQINPAMGAVTKGMMSLGDISPKDRIFDWDRYNNMVNRMGGSPQLATISALPKYRMNPDLPIMYEPVEDTKRLSLGSISRASESGDMPDSWTGRLKALSEQMAKDKYGALRNKTVKSFEDLLRDNPDGGLDASTVLEVIGKSKSPTLSRLRDLNPMFKTEPGAIARGEVNFTPDPLQEYYRNFLDEELSNDVRWDDPDNPEVAAKVLEMAKREAGDRLREMMKDNSEYIGAFDRYNGISRVKPFEHLRDVSTPK